MMELYPCKHKGMRMLWLFMLVLGLNALAATEKPPFEALFSHAQISKQSLSSGFPKLYKLVSKEAYTTAEVNQWIKEAPKEWKAFQELPGIKKLNVAWATLGIELPAQAPAFRHSMYEWYKASGITDEKRKVLFPHFPLPNLNNEVGKEEEVYAQKIGAWQRLYPAEYEQFINTPELTALNPYYTGYYKLPYMPAFIGQVIGIEKPRKEDTGQPVMDEYNYQLKLRNWYFVFKPAEYEKMYGKDYVFPDTFDAESYRTHTIRILNETKAGTYPNLQNGH